MFSTNRIGRSRSFQKIELDDFPIGRLTNYNHCSNCGSGTGSTSCVEIESTMDNRPIVQSEDPIISTSVQSESHTEKYRTGVKFIASVDIIYTLLLIALHLLTLITTNATHNTTNLKNGPNNDSEQSLLGNDRVKYEYKKTHATHPWSRSGDSVYDGSGDEAFSTAAELSSKKSDETIGTMIWIGMFAICILELLVAGALYGGTKERDAKITIRNGRIWIYTAIFLNSISLFQFLGIFIMGTHQDHIIRLSVLGIEFLARLIGICVISKFIKLLKYELLDLGLDEHILYYELLGPGVSSSLTTGTMSSSPTNNNRTTGRRH